jgi:hypothetical protein
MRSNELLQKEVDAFIASSPKLEDEEIIRQADAYEHEIYQK